ncbi:MAG: GDP-L-fucose synthase [Spirulina sp. SIO3F2]|nr:GDP-L-fucose synthase [Spirulina sp. SIO3F2]
MEQNDKIFVAGNDTLIGSALVRQLKSQGYSSLVGQGDRGPDLRDARSVDTFFAAHKPDYVFLVAGESGGILANQHYPAQLMRDNLLVQTHVIESAYRHGVRKLLYLASSCSYPKHAAQPLQIDSLLTGPLEPTNVPYSVAKLAGLHLCQAYRQQYQVDFIVGIPANAFGIGDDFALETAHVIPALIHKLHWAKLHKQPSIDVWGTGQPRREFVFADDLADACLFVMQHYSNSLPINLGGGTDLSIRELAELLKAVVGYQGRLNFDTSKPDGMPLKALDSTPLLSLGWQPQTALESAIAATYQWFRETADG